MLEHVEHRLCWLQDVESNEVTVTYMLFMATSSVPAVLCFRYSVHTHTETQFQWRLLFFFPKSCSGANMLQVIPLSWIENDAAVVPPKMGVPRIPTEVQNERHGRLGQVSIIDCSKYQFPKSWAINYTPVDGLIWINIGEDTNWCIYVYLLLDLIGCLLGIA